MSDSKTSRICKKCKKSFEYKPDDVFWDEQGYGYSTKLCVCKNCGTINILKYKEDYGFDVNYDERFYE